MTLNTLEPKTLDHHFPSYFLLTRPNERQTNLQTTPTSPSRTPLLETTKSPPENAEVNSRNPPSLRYMRTKRERERERERERKSSSPARFGFGVVGKIGLFFGDFVV